MNWTIIYSHNFSGDSFRTMGTIIPSFVIIILVVLFLDTIAENPYVQGLCFTAELKSDRDTSMIS